MRTPEEGHTKQCLAAAMIAVIQDARDDEHTGDVGFRLLAQSNAPLYMADKYLADGTATCTCPPINHGLHGFANGCEGHESLAGEHMGETVFCNGTCRVTTHLRQLAPKLTRNDRVTDDPNKVDCEHCLDQM